MRAGAGAGAGPAADRAVRLLKPEALARYLEHRLRTAASPPSSPTQPRASRPSCLLGLDVGGSKIGVAISDAAFGFARPLGRIDRRADRPFSEFPRQCGRELARLVEAHNVCGLVVGYPLELWTGQPGPRCAEVFRFIERVYRDAPEELAVPFALWDERMTTQEARQALQASGKRKGRQQAAEDQVAATLILQGYLSTHLATLAPDLLLPRPRRPPPPPDAPP